MGEHTAGQAAVGPDPTQHPLPFPEAPRISDAGRGPQRKLRYQGFLEVNQGEDREREAQHQWRAGVPDCTEQEAEDQGGRDLMGPRAPGVLTRGCSTRTEPRPPLPTSRNPKLWATPPSGAFPRALTFRQQFWQEGVQGTAFPALYGFS